MAFMRMMQVVAHEVIDMIAVRNRVMPAARSVLVPWLMAGAVMVRRAPFGIGVAHLEAMLVDMVAMGMMQMAVMRVIQMVAMADRGVPASRPMRMRVPDMRRFAAARHGSSFRSDRQ